MSDSYIRPDEDFEAFYLKYYKFVYRVCFIYMKTALIPKTAPKTYSPRFSAENTALTERSTRKSGSRSPL